MSPHVNEFLVHDRIDTLLREGAQERLARAGRGIVARPSTAPRRLEWLRTGWFGRPAGAHRASDQPVSG